MNQGPSHSNVWQLFEEDSVGQIDDSICNASLDLSDFEENASQKEKQSSSTSEETESTIILPGQVDLPEPIYVSEESNQEASEKPLIDKEHSTEEVQPSFEKTCCAETEKKLERLMAIQQDLISKQAKNIQSLLADNLHKNKRIVALTQLLESSNALVLACNQNLEAALQANAVLLSKLSQATQTAQAPTFCHSIHPLIQVQSYIPTFSLKTAGQSQTTETSTPQQRPSNN
jgi:hypothetical protein